MEDLQGEVVPGLSDPVERKLVYRLLLHHCILLLWFRFCCFRLEICLRMCDFILVCGQEGGEPTEVTFQASQALPKFDLLNTLSGFL